MNLKLSFEGVPKEASQKIADGLSEILGAIMHVDDSLDLRRIESFIIARDFGQSIKSISEKHKRDITYTDESYGSAWAKVLCFRVGDDYEINVLFDLRLFGVFLADDAKLNAENLGFVAHIIHHELCHVHEDNIRLDLLKGVMLEHQYQGKKRYFWPTAERCWSEYYACNRSSTTAHEIDIKLNIDTLREAIPRTKQELQKEILSYRTHANLELLVGVLERHGAFLPISASYVIGYKQSPEWDSSSLFTELSEQIDQSYFDDTWYELDETLSKMSLLFPDGVADLEFYGELALTIEKFYAQVGFLFEDMDGDNVYVRIP